MITNFTNEINIVNGDHVLFGGIIRVNNVKELLIKTGVLDEINACLFLIQSFNRINMINGCMQMNESLDILLPCYQHITASCYLKVKIHNNYLKRGELTLPKNFNSILTPRVALMKPACYTYPEDIGLLVFHVDRMLLRDIHRNIIVYKKHSLSGNELMLKIIDKNIFENL